tara:strand:- start:160 stop:378 length:219 start_codon:yes stop_codon:yes gene_type:complete
VGPCDVTVVAVVEYHGTSGLRSAGTSGLPRSIARVFMAFLASVTKQTVGFSRFWDKLLAIIGLLPAEATSGW